MKRFSIITPSFRSGSWLRLCIPSVADQGVDLEHIVQDSLSDDGTLDWLPQDSRVQAHVEKDQGMYDAVNRGLRRTQGEFCAYLNCDEQYLPGALAAVETYFQQHPSVDVVFADAVVVDPQGRYLCHRPAILPTRAHTLVSGTLAILTCATFFRRRLLAREQFYFDLRWRTIGDAAWILQLLKQNVSMGVLRRFTTAFTDTGQNLSLHPTGQREIRELFASAPRWARRFHRLVTLQYRWRKLAAGLYWQKPFEYSIYTSSSPERRVAFPVSKPTARWRR